MTTQTPVEPVQKKRRFFSPKVRVALALIVIGIGVVLAFYGPRERDSNFLGEVAPITPTIVNPLGTLTVKRSIDYRNIHFTISSVAQASSFSDDRMSGGNYVVRVQMAAQVVSGQQQPLAFDFPSQVRLRLADGRLIAPKLVDLSPDIVPGRDNTGFIDFPLDTPTSLPGLALRLGSDTTLPFS